MVTVSVTASVTDSATRRPLRALAGLVALVGAASPIGCKPDLDQSVSIVTDPVVLAVRSDPAEVAPMGNVQLTALYVDGAGVIASAPLSWAFCTARNPLANLGSVNPKCLQASGDWLLPIGNGGVQVSGTIPDIACKQFGPNVPQPDPGQPQGRPVDPDPTGGYYQPARLFVPSDAGTLTDIAETRLSCGAGNASGQSGIDFTQRYHLNTNPEIASLGIVQGSSSLPWAMDDLGDGGEGGTPPGPNAVKAGAHVTLRVAWDACPATDRCGDGLCGPDETEKACPSDCTTAGTQTPAPRGCTGAERFANFDIASQAVFDDRESIGVSWFTTAGSFDSDRTGRGSADTTTSSDNGWTAPDKPGPVHLWVVLRDDRGGTGWGEYTILVM
jgi:hypothetical protein